MRTQRMIKQEKVFLDTKRNCIQMQVTYTYRVIGLSVVEVEMMMVEELHDLQRFQVSRTYWD